MLIDASMGGGVIVRPKSIPYKCGDTTHLVLISDPHIGSRMTRYSKLKQDLDMALELNARINFNGDIFDGIYPSDKKRYSNSAVHPDLMRDDLEDAAVEAAVEILKPYAHLIDMIGIGNHEKSLLKYHSSDICRRLVKDLKKDGSPVQYGGMNGFIDYRFRRNGEGGTRRFVIYYFHGKGGSSPVTKGIISFSRMLYVRADMVWLGHTHTRLMEHTQDLECPLCGDVPRKQDRRHVITGGYSDIYGGQSQKSIEKDGRISNYAADAQYQPSGMGGALVKIHHGSKESTVKVEQ